MLGRGLSEEQRGGEDILVDEELEGENGVSL